MLILCPNTEEEVDVRYGICPSCGEEHRRDKVTYEPDTFEKEDEWTESDWGQDTEFK